MTNFKVHILSFVDNVSRQEVISVIRDENLFEKTSLIGPYLLRDCLQTLSITYNNESFLLSSHFLISFSIKWTANLYSWMFLRTVVALLLIKDAGTGGDM